MDSSTSLRMGKILIISVLLLQVQGFLMGQHLSRSLTVQSKMVEPFPFISGKFSGKEIPESPDPLVGYKWGKSSANDGLEIYVLHPKSITCNQPGQVKFGNDNNLPIKINGPCDLFFDFGRENAGWLEFDSDNPGGKIEMSISEYREPAILNAGAHHPIKTLVPIRHGSTYRLELNDELYEGVRFGWIHIKTVNRPFNINDVRLVCQVKPTNYQGSFSCSNPLLNRIWYTGAYTVKLNLQKDFFGAILMERSDRFSWTGDAYPSQAASMVAFGNYDFVRKNLFHTSTQSNSIASYPIYWVLSLIDYSNYTGDQGTLSELTENACQKLDTAYTHFDQTKGLAFNGWDERLGAGFENPDCLESQFVYQTLIIQAWEKFGQLMKWKGRNDLAEKYERFVSEKMSQLRRTKGRVKNLGIHAASNLLNSGVANREEEEMFWKNLFIDRLQRLSYSPFNQLFIVQAMAKMGKYEEALTTINDCWGGQLRYGGTSFFEVYRPSWNDAIGRNGAPVNNQCGYTSLAHPWSAGITKWLTEEMMGIKPTTPGFSTFIVKPNLSSEIDWVNGAVPTLQGIIELSYNKKIGEIKLKVPGKTIAKVGIPKTAYKIGNILVNGKKATQISDDQNYVFIENLPCGLYTIKFQPRATIALLTREALTYNLQPATEDSITRGNWKSKYGSKGYILCNYDSINGNCKKLPDFMDGIDFRLNGNVHLTGTTPDLRALMSLQGNERKLGAIVTQDPSPCLQTMTIDIHCITNQSYQIALYMVDWEGEARRSALEVFDLNNKELLMPVQQIKDYQNGKYLVLRVDRSIRLRINQIRGRNASLSALFID